MFTRETISIGILLTIGIVISLYVGLTLLGYLCIWIGGI